MAIEAKEVAKSSVQLDKDGHLTISDPKVLELLKAKNLGNTHDLSRPNISVGIVVSF